MMRTSHGSSLAFLPWMRRRVVTIRTCGSCGGELRQAITHTAARTAHHGDTSRISGAATYTCIVCGRSQILPLRRAADLRQLSE